MSATTTLQKARLLLSLLPHNPGELVDRVITALAGRLGPRHEPQGHYVPVELQQGMAQLEGWLGVSLLPFFAEPALLEVENAVRASVERLRGSGPFTPIHNGDLVLGRICYAACRSLAPERVVETGVAYGVTSAFILQALAVTGRGQLHSIDLPPLAPEADRFVGAHIPAQLRKAWTLHRGTSRRVLPRVLAQLGSIDLFVHDSLHTFANMRRELEVVTPTLRRPCLVLSDDINDNAAFERWAVAHAPGRWVAVREESKQSLVGAAVLR